MILQHPYDFRGLKWVDTKDAVHAINRYIVTDYSYIHPTQMLQIKPFEGSPTLKPVILYGTTAAEKEISPLAHPLVNPNQNWIALDLRSLVHVDSETQKLRVRNESTYQFAVQRFILSGVWATGGQSKIYSFKFPQLVYGEFISTGIARKFGLHSGDRVRLKILACMFYASLFTNAELTDEDLDKLRLRLDKEIFVQDLFDEVFAFKHLMTNLDGFGQACYELTQNVRLKGLDFNAIISTFVTSWSVQEVLLAGLKHPPTWCALVATCLTERNYKNSALAKSVDEKDKRDAGKDYLKELSAMLHEYKAD